MKKILSHLFSRALPIFARNPRQGAALVMVLGCVVLVTSLIVAYFGNVSTEYKLARYSETATEVKSYADTAINLVIGQIREATPDNGLQSWISQPGLLRTYDDSGAPVSAFKLYSSDIMRVDDDFDPLAELQDEVPPDWADAPDEFVDLNEPIVTEYGSAYPIIDGNDLKTILVNGNNRLTYDANGDSKPDILGFDMDPEYEGEANLVPMPVRWLYVLRDGKLAPMSDGKISGAEASNPAVARIAFWADDESCKINVNTASEGVFWDFPRIGGMIVNSGEYDRDPYSAAPLTLSENDAPDRNSEWRFKDFQPVKGEFQRTPGHPAMNCLSPVFGSLELLERPVPRDDGNQPGIYNTAGVETFFRYYDLTPKINYTNHLSTRTTVYTQGAYMGYSPLALSAPHNDDLAGSDCGTRFSGMDFSATHQPFTVEPDTDRLYPTVDCLAINPNPEDDNYMQVPHASNLSNPTDDEADDWVELLMKSRFFLTTNSRAPELNAFNKPRMTLWPMTVDNNLWQQTTEEQLLEQASRIGSAADADTAFDGTGRYGRLYAFVRDIVNKSTTDGDIIEGRNDDLYDYLQNVTDAKVPGYGESLAATYGDVNRNQILTSIWDYTRSAINLNTYWAHQNSGSATLPDDTKNYYYAGKVTYGSQNVSPRGNGQVTPLVHNNGTAGLGRTSFISHVNVQLYGSQYEESYFNGSEWFPRMWNNKLATTNDTNKIDQFMPTNTSFATGFNNITPVAGSGLPTGVGLPGVWHVELAMAPTSYTGPNLTANTNYYFSGTVAGNTLTATVDGVVGSNFTATTVDAQSTPGVVNAGLAQVYGVLRGAGTTVSNAAIFLDDLKSSPAKCRYGKPKTLGLAVTYSLDTVSKGYPDFSPNISIRTTMTSMAIRIYDKNGSQVGVTVNAAGLPANSEANLSWRYNSAAGKAGLQSDGGQMLNFNGITTITGNASATIKNTPLYVDTAFDLSNDQWEQGNYFTIQDLQLTLRVFNNSGNDTNDSAAAPAGISTGITGSAIQTIPIVETNVPTRIPLPLAMGNGGNDHTVSPYHYLRGVEGAGNAHYGLGHSTASPLTIGSVPAALSYTNRLARLNVTTNNIDNTYNMQGDVHLSFEGDVSPTSDSGGDFRNAMVSANLGNPSSFKLHRFWRDSADTYGDDLKLMRQQARNVSVASLPQLERGRKGRTCTVALTNGAVTMSDYNNLSDGCVMYRNDGSLVGVIDTFALVAGQRVSFQNGFTEKTISLPLAPAHSFAFGYDGKPGTGVIMKGDAGGATYFAGDWDNNLGTSSDGASINKADEGSMDFTMSDAPTRATLVANGIVEAYKGNLHWLANASTQLTSNAKITSPLCFSPARQIPSPVMLGSLPSRVFPGGLQGWTSGWQTLLFNPNPASEYSISGWQFPTANSDATTEHTWVTVNGVGSPKRHRGFGDANPTVATRPGAYTGKGVPDHVVLDLFRMPVVEPYPIADAVSSAGQINLNYQIAPFTYIRRQTGIYSLLTSLQMTGINSEDNSRSTNYKQLRPGPQSTSNQNNNTVRLQSATTYAHTRHLMNNYDCRYNINIPETMQGFENRWTANNPFRLASEICEMFLAPENIPGGRYSNVNYPNPAAGNPQSTVVASTDLTTANTPGTGGLTYNNLQEWWDKMKLTGDNSREQPYNHLYNRVTNRSNVFTVYYRVQKLAKSTLTPPDEFVPGRDNIAAEYRGSAMLERYLDPQDARLTTAVMDDIEAAPSTTGGTLNPYYKFRVMNNKQFAP